jgi:mRNA interferase RelE/StbE
VRSRIEVVVFGEEFREDPYLQGKVEKLRGYQSFYKLRFGDYRLGIHLDTASHLVEFQRVLHRREIYRKLP